KSCERSECESLHHHLQSLATEVTRILRSIGLLLRGKLSSILCHPCGASLAEIALPLAGSSSCSQLPAPAVAVRHRRPPRAPRPRPPHSSCWSALRWVSSLVIPARHRPPRSHLAIATCQRRPHGSRRILASQRLAREV